MEHAFIVSYAIQDFIKFLQYSVTAAGTSLTVRVLDPRSCSLKLRWRVRCVSGSCDRAAPRSLSTLSERIYVLSNFSEDFFR